MNFTNPQNKPYNAWIHWNITSKCNIDCEYCFGHSMGNEKINKIDIKRLLDTLNKTGKTFRISFTGGEPFLIPNFVEACLEISKGHYISLNTHLLSNRVMEFAEKIDSEKLLMLHASLHFDEIEKMDKWQKFSENYKHCKSKGINIYAEAVAFPGFINKLEYYDNICQEFGIEYQFGPFYGKYNGKKYPDNYTNYEIDLFKLDKEEFTKFYQKGNLCNAGVNVAVAFPRGNVMPCFQIKEKIGHIYEEINFSENVFECKFNYCGCPLNQYDRYLFERANQ